MIHYLYITHYLYIIYQL